jgi:hypothetical protein
MTSQVSTGVEYRRGNWRMDLSYGINPSSRESVGRSALLAGEYSNSSVRIGIQSVRLSTSFGF